MSDQVVNSTAPKLIAYRIHPYPSLPIVPAAAQRKWMDETTDRFAYRCLPLLIANQNGWHILNVHHIRAVWNGGERPSDITVTFRGGPQGMPCPAESHFGHGVLTWSLNYLFRTAPGYNLWCHGPANAPKDGIVPLEGIIETDWSVATFTMNWKFTVADEPVMFEPGEPICTITPIKRGETETFDPVLCDLSSEPQLKEAFEAWSRSREKWNKELRLDNSQAAREGWQKEYLQGYTATGVKAREHQTKLALREFHPPQT